MKSPDGTKSEVHYFEVLVREDPAEEQTLPALHSALQLALRDGPAAETGVSPSADADRNPVGEAASVNAASYPSAFDDRPSAACLALLPVPSGTHLQPEITQENRSNKVTSWTLSKGIPVYQFEQDGYQVISTKSQWAVQAILRLLPGCYLRYGYNIPVSPRWTLVLPCLSSLV